MTHNTRFAHVKRFIGIDVCAAHLDVFCLPEAKTLRVDNTPDAIASLIDRLGQDEWIAACEATGGHETELLIAMNEAGRHIWCLHPGDVRSYARLIGKRAKTDRLDARLIARALEAACKERSPIKRTRIQCNIKQLMALRRHLVTTINEMKALISSFTCDIAMDKARARRDAAQVELADLTRTITALIAGNRQTADMARRIQSVPGAGPVLTAELLASMPELGTLSAKKIASLAGVAPHPRNSGNSQKPGKCQTARASLTRCLYMAALSAIKAKAQIIYPFYQKLRTKGKQFKVAMVAAMRKLITVINAIIRDKTVYIQPQHTP